MSHPSGQMKTFVKTGIFLVASSTLVVTELWAVFVLFSLCCILHISSTCCVLHLLTCHMHGRKAIDWGIKWSSIICPFCFWTASEAFAATDANHWTRIQLNLQALLLWDRTNFFWAVWLLRFSFFSSFLVKSPNKQKCYTTTDAVARDVVAEDVLVLLGNHDRGQDR